MRILILQIDLHFFADAEGNQLVKKGWLNEGGWKDKYVVKVVVPEEAKYLFVSTQNGTVPKVKSTQNGSHYYISTEGELVADDNYQVLSFSVRADETIEIAGTMKGNPYSTARYAFYKDEYGIDIVELGSLNSDGWEDNYSEVVKVPPEATTLLIGGENGAKPTVTWKSDETYLSKPELANKKMGILGDSMAKGNGVFDNNCWPERIAVRNNMEVDNQAINGKYLTQGIWKDSGAFSESSY